jgi:tRNA(Ile)-lysidine synthase
MGGSADLPTEFTAALDRLGPFEPKPHLAVAVSGGPDSLALALLADAWARRRGGGVTALTVDHRLRPDSAAEAATVAGWLRSSGIRHEILVWRHDGTQPGAGGVQAAARAARYRLLEERCRAEGWLHLLTAHHRDDQAETVLLRLARGSGLDGLAAMTPLVERAAVRVLRPLLGIPAAALRFWLGALGQPFIEDPSNRNRDFARARLRLAWPALDAAGLDAARLADTASRLALARAALEGEVARLLACSLALRQTGHAELALAALLRAPREIALRTLAAIIRTVGGREYPPRLQRLAHLHEALAQDRLGRGRTLGGCLVLRRRGDALLICREPAAVAGALPLEPGRWASWDGRFRVRLDPAAPAGEGWRVAALGTGARHRLGAPAGMAGLPAAVLASLPGLWRGDDLVAVPPLGFRAPGESAANSAEIRFRPRRILTSAGFTAL